MKSRVTLVNFLPTASSTQTVSLVLGAPDKINLNIPM